MSRQSSSSAGIAACTYITFIVLIIAWIGAWVLKISLEQSISWLTTSMGSFFYWVTAKVCIWIVPAVWLLKLSRSSVKEVFNFPNWRAWLAWGGGVGLLIALTGIIPNYLQGNELLPTEFSFPLLNVLLVAPAFEEFLMRGAILRNLQEEYSFWAANAATSVMFVILHIPGWHFMGVLWDNLTNPAGGALSIFLVSLCFGYASHRSSSVMGGVLAHCLNNLF
ncbi:MAG: CPBP family intramembrane metalloprotease [Firmicutes bacterium]|nr:CPBP family intramembrane metalloprotease [Bacillota bacterium]